MISSESLSFPSRINVAKCSRLQSYNKDESQALAQLHAGSRRLPETVS
jgi:hypothetical protein